MSVNNDLDVDDVGEYNEKSEGRGSSAVWRSTSCSSIRGHVFYSKQLFDPKYFLNNNINKRNITNTETKTNDKKECLTSTSLPVPTISRNMKILVLGNAKCGKSSLINRYCHGTFCEKYKTTVGADFIRKDISYKPDENDEPIGIRLQLWDIAGQDRFQKLTRAYFAKAKGVIIVCDLHRDGTIDAVRAWKREVSDWACKSGNPNMPIVLFANKCDMLDRADPQVTFKMGACMERICREENVVSWHMTSARSGEGVDEGFNTLISEIMKQELHTARSTIPSRSGSSDHSVVIDSDKLKGENVSSFKLRVDAAPSPPQSPNVGTWCY